MLLGPPTLLDPLGPVTAVLQRTMTALAAGTLAQWSPATRAANAGPGVSDVMLPPGSKV